MTDDQKKLLLDTLLGNVAAAEFCEEFILAAHFWDDLVDRDKILTTEDINRSMWRILFRLTHCDFYREHWPTLQPVMMIAATDWMTATEFEREDDACIDKLATAFSIRSNYLNVIVIAAMIVGGPGYAIKTAPALREYFHKEGFRAYQLSLREERRKRERGEHVH